MLHVRVSTGSGNLTKIGVCVHRVLQDRRYIPVPSPDPARRAALISSTLVPVSISVPGVALLPPGGAAAEAHDECGEEQDDGRCECHPDGVGEARRGTGGGSCGVVVDLVTDDGEDGKVYGHGDERDQECEQGDEG